jgi:glycosyltransferase involved in cell wall biosynthesis
VLHVLHRRGVPVVMTLHDYRPVCPNFRLWTDAAELQQASVAVLPSTWWDNCPMSILEAAASAVPVVASAVGGIRDLVDDGTTGSS